MKTLLILLLTIISSISFLCSNLPAAISISPAYVELTLDKGRPAGKFLITNVGEEEERYRIRALYFHFTEDGVLQEIPPDEHAMASWIKFNPKEFTLPARTKQNVRFVVVPRGKLRRGEYWAAMELESLKTTFAKGDDGEGRSLKVEIIPAILVPIFGKVGDIRLEAIHKGAEVVWQEKKRSIVSLISNTGEGRFFITGRYEIISPSGETVSEGSMGRAYVLPGSSRKFTASLDDAKLPENRYTIRIHYSSEQLEQSISAEIPFELKHRN